MCLDLNFVWSEKSFIFSAPQITMIFSSLDLVRWYFLLLQMFFWYIFIHSLFFLDILWCYDDVWCFEMFIFSSPEHEVLMVSYCGQWLSCVVRRPSSVVRRPSSVNIWCLHSRDQICDLILMKLDQNVCFNNS